MRIKTSELIGAALDWAVLKANGQDFTGFDLRYIDVYPYSTEWAQGGSIIEREGIGILFDSGSACRKPSWFATPDDQCKTSNYEGETFDPAFMVGEAVGTYGPTPLIAAMRCYVASKLGDAVDVPNELIGG